MEIIGSILILLITVVYSIFFLVMSSKAKKYDNLIEPLEGKEFVMKDIYGIGFAIMEQFHISLKGKTAGKLRKECIVIYGEKYAEYYLRVDYARRYSIVALILNFVLLFSCLASGSDKVVILGMGLVITALMYTRFSSVTANMIKDRSKKFLCDFPEVASSIALLVNAGMILTEAWNTVAVSGKGSIYDEMQMVTESVENGKSMEEALNRFANRCSTPEIRKFISIIIQSLDKGNKELEATLKRQSAELWMEKKQAALTEGELASNKLLIPVGIMFVGILVMIMVPIMTNIL